MKPLFHDVIVNGETIASAAIIAEAQNHTAPVDKPGYAWQAAARALAVRTLLLQEAQRANLQADPQEVAEGKLETDDESLIRALLDQELEPRAVDDADCRAIYDKMPEKFRSPDLFEPAHILFMAKPGDAEARHQARVNALAILEALAADPKRFARLAKENSDCPSRDNGGSLGQISDGDTVPEFEAAMKSMSEGEILPTPVETRYGFHVIRLDAKAEGALLPFEAVRPRIQQQLEQLAWAQSANALTHRLVAEAEIDGIDFSKKIGGGLQ